MMLSVDPAVADAATGGALALAYFAGSVHVLERLQRRVDLWARKHAVRRGYTGRRHLRWWLAQLWFAAHIACDFVLSPVETIRYIRQQRRFQQQPPARAKALQFRVVTEASTDNGGQQ
ncbi:hypothetical protein [Streptomyces ipomoeae]|uniref:hypothetical protein n=1 Tax=Streptomyces ipomoeae TaxID=103232 RepID=UPI0015F10F22|nr:hypothetical protein [Streptomyces ipomoeae]